MKYFFTLLFSLLVIAPVVATAQYTELVNIPGIGGSETDGFDGYINAVYAMFISIAALLAVVKIVVAGVKYMFSDIVTQKSEAKKDIQGALLGLVVVLAAVLILTVINPNLTNFDLNTQQLAAPQPQADTNSLSSNDEQTVLDYIEQAQNNGETVTRQSCQYFNSPESLGALGWVAAPADWAINKVGCKVWCDGLGGEVVGGGALTAGECLYVENFDQKDLVENIINETDYCAANGCETLTCTAFRTELSCKDWCDNRGGVNINTSYLFTAQQCLVAKLDLSETTALECEIDGSDADCRGAENLCEISGGLATSELNSNNVQQISCEPLGREVFSCNPTGRGEFNCDSAKAKCTGSRTIDDSNVDRIICE